MEKDTKIFLGAIVVILGLVFVFNSGILGNWGLTVPTTPVTPTCTDTDMGTSGPGWGSSKPLTYGECNCGTSVGKDKCLDTRTLIEYYISGTTCKYQMLNCPSYGYGYACNMSGGNCARMI